MNDLTLIRKNLFRKRIRAALLMMSILIAFLIFGVLAAFNRTLDAAIDVAAADRLITLNKINFTVTMPFAYLERIRSVEGVELAAHANWFGGYYQQPQNVIQVFATDIPAYLAVYDELIVTQGSLEQALENRQCLVIGVDLLMQQGWELGQRVPIQSNIFQRGDGSRTWEFDLCAVIDGDRPEVQANHALMHYEYFNEDLTFGRDQIGWVLVRTFNTDNNAAVAERIDALFANSPVQTETATEAAFGRQFLDAFGNIGLILQLVVGAAFVLILIIVGTTMATAINERTREIAVLKTLGFQSGRIFRQVLSESVLLSVVGGGVGLLLAWGIIAGLRPVIEVYLPGLAVTGPIALAGLGLMLGFGLLTGILPAMNAMRLKIVDALAKG